MKPQAAWFLLLFSAPALGGEHTETFAQNRNPSEWSFGRPEHFGMRNDSSQDSYLYTDDLSAFSAYVATRRPGTPFTGNFKERGVKAIAVDLNLLDSEFPIIERPLALTLVSDNGTPQNFQDDWMMYRLSDEFVPAAGNGWKTFRFEIPSQAGSTPAGWNYLPLGQQSPTQPNWGKLLSNVTEVGFQIGDPSLFYFIMSWHVGIDNPTIETE